MRTNIDIDDRLMRDALAASGAKTKREVVEEGLRMLIRLRSQRQFMKLRGIGWDGDLDVMRLISTNDPGGFERLDRLLPRCQQPAH